MLPSIQSSSLSGAHGVLRGSTEVRVRGLQAGARSSLDRELKRCGATVGCTHTRFRFTRRLWPVAAAHQRARGTGEFAALNHYLTIEKFGDGVTRTAGEATDVFVQIASNSCRTIQIAGRTNRETPHPDGLLAARYWTFAAARRIVGCAYQR
jgi:hypothetical protein